MIGTRCRPRHSAHLLPVTVDLSQSRLLLVALHRLAVTAGRALARPVTQAEDIIEPGQNLSFLSPVRVHDGPAVLYGDVDGASSHQLGLPGVGHLLLILLGLHHDGDVPDLLPEDVAPPLPGWRRRSAWQEGSS